MNPPVIKDKKPRKTKRARCPRCKGKGYRMLCHGPMVMDGQGVPAGIGKYECRTCEGTGTIK